MELSMCNLYTKEYIKYYANKSQEYTVFEESSLCKICMLINRLRFVRSTDKFFEWLGFFNYKMSMQPVLVRCTVLNASIFWAKCVEFMEISADISQESFSCLKIEMLDIISPVEFLYHFCVNQCALHSSVFTDNKERMLLVQKIGEIIMLINSFSLHHARDEKDLLSGTSGMESDDDIGSSDIGSQPISKQDIHNLLRLIVKRQPSNKQHTCLSESQVQKYKTMHQKLLTARAFERSIW